jgi:hypothetical protein
VRRVATAVCYDTAVTTFHSALPARLTTARRQFLARLGFGSAAFGALVAAPLPVQAQSASSGPRRHAADDWMDQLPTAHRMVFDAVSAAGLDDVRHYASNVFTANRTGYGVDSRDVGVIIILRHKATPYGYNDAMWAKYGSVFEPEKGGDIKANSATAGGEGLDALSGLGAHFAVCGMATRRFAGMIARTSGSTADAVADELGKNLVRNAHLTPAGIVAVGRAQERGYVFGYAG